MKNPMKYSQICYEKRGSVAYITLNRPHVLNAMNLKMHEELSLIWNDFEADENIRVGVLSGGSEKAFCVGQDLKELSELNSTSDAQKSSFGSRREASGLRLTERFDRVKPIIAKVQGYALGGGFELALACDIIIASENAQFALPEAKLGLIPGAGGLFRLMRQMPQRCALGYLLTGRMMTARRAWEFGLINEVVSNLDLDDCVDGWIQDILRSAPLSIRAIKEACAKSATLSLEQAFSMDYYWENIRKTSIDAVHGPRAFVEKRPPLWQGR